MTILLLLSMFSFGDPIKVAVIDTGFNMEYSKQIKICPDIGLASFDGPKMVDTNGHGTNVTGLINKYNLNPDVCFIIIKINNQMSSYLNGLRYAILNKANVINYSGGGDSYSPIEEILVRGFIRNGGIMVAAAGNNRRNLNKKCNYYPACIHPNVFMISNPEHYSNKHKKAIVMKRDGDGEEVFGITKHGTSQSTAIFTGMILTYLRKK